MLAVIGPDVKTQISVTLVSKAIVAQPVMHYHLFKVGAGWVQQIGLKAINTKHAAMIAIAIIQIYAVPDHAHHKIICQNIEHAAILGDGDDAIFYLVLYLIQITSWK